MLGKSQGLDSRVRLGVAVRLFLPWFALAVCFGLAFLLAHTRSARQILEEHENRVVDFQEKTLLGDLDNVVSDLKYLAAHLRSSDLFGPDGTLDADAKTHVSRELLNLADKRDVYDQIRFLDEAGREVIRANWTEGNAVLVPESALQDKGSRYYFRETFRLGPDEVFLSPFDLNVEHGEVERPLKPVIRFGMPVHDRWGRKRGILLLNCLGSHLLARFSELNVTETSRPLLLNADGYYLKSTDPEEEWGFLLEDRKDRSFAQSFPGAWRRIRSRPAGQFVSKDGLFTFRTVVWPPPPVRAGSDPGADPDPGKERVPGTACGWKIVSHVPRAILLAPGRAMLRDALVVLSLLAVLLGAGARLLAGDRLARRRTEEDMRVSELQYSSVVSTAHDAIITIDAAGAITFWNAAAERIFGYAEEEILGENVTRIIPDRLKRSHVEKIARLARGEGEGRSDALVFEGLRKDGSEVPLEMSVSSWRTPDGVFRTGILRDISERKRAEEALVKAREEAEAASRAKSTFLASMSHEIRTPMNGVIGMTELLLGTELTEEQREFAETVRSSGDALLLLINDILDFSKIEAGKLDLESIDFDLRSLVEEVTDLLALRAQDKGINLAGFLELDVCEFVVGDPGRLRQILINLAGNAIKFTEAGEVSICGSLASETDTTECVRFEVTDTGVGIPEEAKRTLFESFTQADASTTRRYGGTGLGLTISRRLVEMMGGSIGFDSEEGKGSTFWFTVVLGKQPAERRRPRERDVDLGSKRVLVVDDYKTNRDILRLQLRSWGCEVEEAPDAPRGLERIRRRAAEGNPFHIAILDMQMPGMSGEDLGRAIKNDPAVRPTLLVMLTSVGQRGDARRMREVGFSAYLTKPIKQSQLHDCLVALLDREKDQRAEPGKPLVTRHTISEERRHRARVLLAEDNVVNQKVAMSMLEKLGVQVDSVENGKEAVSAVAERIYDAVLMDCQMPEMDGYAATKEIRSREVGDRHIPIIAMTANALQGDRERCLAAGMDDYVSKPVKVAALQEVLRRWILD